MSDNDSPKKSGYRLEYASTGRAKCTGPKPCKGSQLPKGELRFGSLVDFQGKTSFQWRHWGCVTPKIITNMKNSFNEADELDGFDDLSEEDQERIKKAWEDGHVAPEDVPETAQKADGEDDEDEDKPKKKGGKKAAVDLGPGVFKFEYASSSRSKCKTCGETVGKDFFRLGEEVAFRGAKSFAWRHWGCADDKLVEKMKVAYDEPSKVEGFADLQEGEKEKVQRAWDEGKIPDDDKGPGEAVDTGKKKAAPRKKKADNGEEKPKRGRAKAKVRNAALPTLIRTTTTTRWMSTTRNRRRAAVQPRRLPLQRRPPPRRRRRRTKTTTMRTARTSATRSRPWTTRRSTRRTKSLRNSVRSVSVLPLRRAPARPNHPRSVQSPHRPRSPRPRPNLRPRRSQRPREERKRSKSPSTRKRRTRTRSPRPLVLASSRQLLPLGCQLVPLMPTPILASRSVVFIVCCSCRVVSRRVVLLAVRVDVCSLSTNPCIP
ncbi:poly polymerase and DNA-ligase Zn-finger region-domain-containing protein [Daedaleopsis nitida]|nr:poly polymerase and DNA-ligase Zn-finger region-domain-containing protein [Daedaleopsis nitida]